MNIRQAGMTGGRDNDKAAAAVAICCVQRRKEQRLAISATDKIGLLQPRIVRRLFPFVPARCRHHRAAILLERSKHSTVLRSFNAGIDERRFSLFVPPCRFIVPVNRRQLYMLIIVMNDLNLSTKGYVISGNPPVCSDHLSFQVQCSQKLVTAMKLRKAATH